LRKKNENARRKEKKFNRVSFSRRIIRSGVRVSDSKQSETLEISMPKGVKKWNCGSRKAFPGSNRNSKHVF
jgi:hypothetical protein